MNIKPIATKAAYLLFLLIFLSLEVFAVNQNVKKIALAGAGLLTAYAGYEAWEHYYNRNHTFDQILQARREAIENNPSFLAYKSLEQENSISNLPVHGKIPHWLQGTLLRVGPGKFETEKQPILHAFDGFAMLHSFSFKNGDVAYANKFLQTKYYKNALATGYVKNNFTGYQSTPLFNLVSSFIAALTQDVRSLDNANINIASIDNTFVAMTETPTGIEFDINNLTTTGSRYFNTDISGKITTAHPHIDNETGEFINYLTQFGRTSNYNIYKINPRDQKQHLIASVPTDKPSYMHSFGLTKNYIILTEVPFRVNPLKLIVMFKPFIQNFSWEPEVGTIFTIVDRHNGTIIGRYQAEPFFMFHHVNAFEEDNKIHVDLVAHKDARSISSHSLDDILLRGDHGQENKKSRQLKRYTVDLEKASVTAHALCDLGGIEMPRINDQYNTKPYTYAYCLSDWKLGIASTLVKINVSNRSVQYWHKDGCYPGEPVFVASPNNRGEDNGIVMSVVLDTNAKNSFLLILNASTFTELARVMVPHHIPFGLHGNFYRN